MHSQDGDGMGNRTALQTKPKTGFWQRRVQECEFTLKYLESEPKNRFLEGKVQKCGFTLKYSGV